MPEPAAPADAQTSPRDGERGTPRVAIFTDKLDWHVEHTLAAFRAHGAHAGRRAPRRLPDRHDAPAWPRHSRLSRACPTSPSCAPSATARWRRSPCGSACCMRWRRSACRSSTARAPSSAAPTKAWRAFCSRRAGVPTPETFATQSLAQARAIARRECGDGPLVMKPLFGAQGWGIATDRREEDMPVARRGARRLLSAALRRPRAARLTKTCAFSSRVARSSPR